MRRNFAKGFTLLEVMIATSIMAVGAMSVMIVFTTAAGMASQRVANLRVAEVVREARDDARTVINAFRPVKAPQPSASKSGTKPGAAQKTETKTAPDPVKDRQSSHYAGFLYDVDFRAKDPAVPEKGYDVTIRIHYGDPQAPIEKIVPDSFAPTSIPEEEFANSVTFDEEQAGKADVKGAREKR